MWRVFTGPTRIPPESHGCWPSIPITFPWDQLTNPKVWIRVQLNLWFPMELSCIFRLPPNYIPFHWTVVVFDREFHLPPFWLGPMENVWFPLSHGLLWFSSDSRPQPSWKKNVCRIRHCWILFLINSFSESLIINPSPFEKKRILDFHH